MAQSFVFPEDVDLKVDDDGVSIEFAGDIVLPASIGGRPIRRVVSHGGNVSLASGESVGHVEAHGNVRVAGDLRAAYVRAGGSVHVGGEIDVASLEVGGNLHAARGLSVPTLRVRGNLSVEGAAQLQTPTLGGDALFHGDVSAGVLRARTLRFNGGTLTAKGVQADTRITVGEVRLQVDAVVAPEVHLSPTTSGRAAVIESLNELAASSVKGGFRLTEYAEMFGSADGFLADRGLSPLDPAAQIGGGRAGTAAPEETEEAPRVAPAERHHRAVRAAPVHVVEPEPAPEPEPEPEPVVEAAPEPVVEAAVEAAPEVPVYAAPTVDAESEPAGPAPAAVAPARAAPEYVSAPTSWEPMVEMPTSVSMPVVVEVAEPPPPVEAVPDSDPLSGAAEHPMHDQLAHTVQRIVDCYAEAELPPAVERLRALVESRSYAEVRAEITNIWSELLKYHQKKGIRIHHQVTTTFNAVNSLVKKM